MTFVEKKATTGYAMILRESTGQLSQAFFNRLPIGRQNSQVVNILDKMLDFTWTRGVENRRASSIVNESGLTQTDNSIHHGVTAALCEIERPSESLHHDLNQVT